MEALGAGTLAYVSSLLTVFGLYPYRDFVKIFSTNLRMQNMDIKSFCLERYRGMITHPSQPMLLAAPQGALYFGFVLGGYGGVGAILGGILAGYTKMFVGTVARRMNGQGGRYNRIGSTYYSSFADCLLRSTKQYGPLSFVCGGVGASVIAVLWHGVTLATLQRGRGRGGFFENFWDAFRMHAFMTFLTSPVRNTFRSALSSRERAGGVHSLRSYVSGEVATFQEAAGVCRSMFRTEGIAFFLHGVLRTTFKTSVPFAITFAAYRAFGGPIGPRSSRGGRDHDHHGGRHMLRRW